MRSLDDMRRELGEKFDRLKRVTYSELGIYVINWSVVFTYFRFLHG